MGTGTRRSAHAPAALRPRPSRRDPEVDAAGGHRAGAEARVVAARGARDAVVPGWSVRAARASCRTTRTSECGAGAGAAESWSWPPGNVHWGCGGIYAHTGTDRSWDHSTPGVPRLWGTFGVLGGCAACRARAPLSRHYVPGPDLQVSGAQGTSIDVGDPVLLLLHPLITPNSQPK